MVIGSEGPPAKVKKKLVLLKGPELEPSVTTPSEVYDMLADPGTKSIGEFEMLT